MVETQKISVTKTSRSRLDEIDYSKLPFGNVFADHMFVADYQNGKWGNLNVVPYANMLVSPASPAIHYGQSIFEGLKAYCGPDNSALIFRPQANLQRLNISADRMCMPPVPEEIFMDGLLSLLSIDKKWIPREAGSSFYIRPFLFSSDEYIGIRPSQNFKFMIITCPVGPYYSEPVNVKIETRYTRAIAGGTGFAKAGGNYGGAIYPSKIAQKEGYHQLIWTDGKTHEYIEESGTMNVMFMIDGILITPELGDTILHGITRDSVLTIARHWGMRVEERKISVTELIRSLREEKVTEAFGVGTAATIAPIAMIGHDGNKYFLPDSKEREFSNKLFNELEDLKRGRKEDPFGWVYRTDL